MQKQMYNSALVETLELEERRPLSYNINSHIVISKTAYPRQVQISTACTFFNVESVIVKALPEYNCIQFRIPSFDYMGKTYKPQKSSKSNYFHFHITADLPLGKLIFDQNESNEDVLTAYYQ